MSNPLRFQGQYHDRETGLHYNRYRYYDPGVGRFVSKDPISYAGGLNLHLYAPNLIEWVDPLGPEKVVAAKSRVQALRLAQQHAQVPIVGRGGEDITTQQLRVESRGKNYACLCARDSTLGREEIGGQAQVFDHPDGHPHMVGEGFPAHHDGSHVHAKNKKGEGIIFTYPG
ncbi:RHS repeat-associated core domain-containing protein [Pseudomonas sp. NBRC 111117]|uniref:RHS repeat-associated core domain-containing protein n=1 Tax=Pseudomonas sp. FBF18 TaxID=1451377 RepID=UPI0009E6C366|nr:RHS repeat-associated core domain-containing protein [Pseudomonas sp. NBRC 111117]